MELNSLFSSFNISNLLLFLIFIIPGFISNKVYSNIIATKDERISNMLFETIAYSCLNYGLLSPIIIITYRNNLYENYFWLFVCFLILVIFLFPILLGYIASKIVKSKIFRRNFVGGIKNPWDFVFSQRESRWVIIFLKNGEKIGGVYSSNSFSSSYPFKEQIYIEQRWEIGINNKFIKPIANTKGTIVLSDEISHINFY